VAHLWISESDGWAVLPLEEGSVTLGQVSRAAGRDPAGCPAVLHRTRAGGREEWHLIAPAASGIAVNGLPLPGGLRTLDDRDELRLPGLGRVYFSTERQAVVEPLPDTGREVSCPRCRQGIAQGTPAVRCPGCELWHHASDELPCWSYAPTCALCSQSTESGAGFRWTPEGL